MGSALEAAVAEEVLRDAGKVLERSGEYHESKENAKQRKTGDVTRLVANINATSLLTANYIFSWNNKIYFTNV